MGRILEYVSLYCGKLLRVCSDLTGFFVRFQTQETQRLLAEPVPGIKAVPHEENARYFDVIVDGPKEVGRCVMSSKLETDEIHCVVFLIYFRRFHPKSKDPHLQEEFPIRIQKILHRALSSI